MTIRNTGQVLKFLPIILKYPYVCNEPPPFKLIFGIGQRRHINFYSRKIVIGETSPVKLYVFELLWFISSVVLFLHENITEKKIMVEFSPRLIASTQADIIVVHLLLR